jgi:hypothetical protein
VPRNDLYTRHTIYVVLALEVSSSEPATGNWLLEVEFEARMKRLALIPKVGRVWRGGRCDLLSFCSLDSYAVARVDSSPSSFLFVSPSDLEPLFVLFFLFLLLVFLLRLLFQLAGYTFSAIVLDREHTRYISFKMIDIQNHSLHRRILGPAISTSISNRTNLHLRTWHPLPSPTIIPFPPW